MASSVSSLLLTQVLWEVAVSCINTDVGRSRETKLTSGLHPSHEDAGGRPRRVGGGTANARRRSAQVLECVTPRAWDGSCFPGQLPFLPRETTRRLGGFRSSGVRVAFGLARASGRASAPWAAPHGFSGSLLPTQTPPRPPANFGSVDFSQPEMQPPGAFSQRGAAPRKLFDAQGQL